jgi:hypothetical protein
MTNHFGPRTTLIGAADVTDATTFPCSRTGGKDELPHAELVKSALAGVFGSFRSLRWVFASQVPGFKADFDRTTGLGTDNSGVLSAEASKPGTMLVIDADTVFDQIVIGSESVVDGLGLGKVMKRKGRPNSGGPMFINAHPVAYPTTPIDGQITVRNLFIDANRRGGGAGNTTTLVIYNNDRLEVVPTIVIAGVERPVVENVYVYDPVAYAVQLSNCRRPYVSNLGADKVAGDDVKGNAILQVQGGTFGLRAYGLYGSVKDDPFALNANDANDFSTAGDTTVTYAPGTVGSGPIRDVVLKGAAFTGGTTVCRFLSANSTNDITNVLIDGASNACTYNGFHFDTFNIPGDGGWCDDIRIVNCRVTGNVAAAIYFNVANFGIVTADKLTAYCTGQYARLEVNAHGRLLQLLNPRMDNSLDPAVDVLGSVEVRVVNPTRGTGTWADQALVDVSSASPKPVSVLGGTVDSVANLVRASVAVPGVLVSSVRHRYARGGPAVQSSVALPRVTLAGLDALGGYGLPSSGSVVKSDGSPDYARALVVERFRGAAGVTLTAQTPDVGAAWGAGVVANNNLKQTGDGWLYLATFDEANPVGTQPSSGNFKVLVDGRRLSALASGQQLNVILFGTADVADRLFFSFDGTGCRLIHTTTVLEQAALLPALGVVRSFVITVTSSGNDRTVKVDYSDDGGVTVGPLLPAVTETDANPPRVMLYGSAGGVGGQSPTTGHQFANFVLME